MVELSSMAGPPQPDKLCPSCGTRVPGVANLCSTCGYNFNTGPFSQPPGSPMGYAGRPAYGDPNWQANYPRQGYGPGPLEGNGKEGLAVASLVLGILSVLLFCFWYFGIVCAILAIIFGVIGKNSIQRGMAIAGIVLGAIGLAIDLLIPVLAVAMLSSGAIR
jgi:hypothetical protein